MREKRKVKPVIPGVTKPLGDKLREEIALAKANFDAAAEAFCLDPTHEKALRMMRCLSAVKSEAIEVETIYGRDSGNVSKLNAVAHQLRLSGFYTAISEVGDCVYFTVSLCNPDAR